MVTGIVIWVTIILMWVWSCYECVEATDDKDALKWSDRNLMVSWLGVIYIIAVLIKIF